MANIYLKLGNIKGSVTTKGHEEWINVQSFQFGVGRGISTPVGNSKNREASSPSISEVTFTKEMDQSSPYLFNEGCVGKSLKAVFHFCRTAADTSGMMAAGSPASRASTEILQGAPWPQGR